MTSSLLLRSGHQDDDAESTRRNGLKVLIVGVNYAPETSGIAPYTTALARGLAARGHKVRVLTAMPHYPEWQIRPGYNGSTRHETIDGVKVTRLRHYVPERPAGLHRLFSEVTFGLRVVFARWHSPDVVLFVSPALFATGLGMWRAVSGLRSIPTAVWLQDLYSLGIVETGVGRRGGLIERVITGVESWVVRNAKSIVVIHDRFAASAERLGATANRVRVIRNWSHVGAGMQRSRAAVRQRLGWGADEVIALHSGNMGVKQDLGNILDAARIADERKTPMRFVFVGRGSERTQLEARANREGIKSLTFLDPLAEQEYLSTLRAADVLVVNELPGLREMAVPSKLTSYFAAGLPVIAASDVESITSSEVAAAGAGVRVDPARPAALLDAVMSVTANASQARRYGANGRAYRAAVLTEDAAMEAFDSMLATMTRTNARAAYASRAHGHGSSQTR